jgi:hypothetical protein
MLKDEKEQEQLRREIQLQFAAKHPNIVEMIGLSKDADKNLVKTVLFFCLKQVFYVLDR